MTETPLLDCPFCGGKAIRVQHPGIWTRTEEEVKQGLLQGGMHGLWYVGCPADFFETNSPMCHVKPAACWFADLALAEQMWNRRFS